MTNPVISNTPATVASRMRRIDSVDLYRGVIMVIMLLDHVRERVHLDGMIEQATDPATSNWALYVTRWATHLCAPAFVLLAGTSAGLMKQRGLSTSGISRYLLTRGLVLILIEIFVVRPLVFFNVNPLLFAFLETIWAIGFSMIVLSLLVYLPQRAILAIGLLIVFGHNALDSMRVPPFFGSATPTPTTGATLWIILHQGGLFPFPIYHVSSGTPLILVGYPVLPWIGVMALGYCLAELYSWNAERRKKTLMTLGITMTALFFIIRGVNVYGDVTPWKSFDNLSQTIFSFFNLQKYPPSLSFLLATLAPCALVLAYADTKPLTSKLSRWFITFGKVPMFYFLTQWLWVHFVGGLVNVAYGQSLSSQTISLTDYMFGPQPGPSGGPLWLVYPAWLLGAILLYFPCRWYADLRARRRDITLLRYI
ncbi:MAG: heparan-alpha-glucosaminide N-acetyltransferase domain-containing protein [Gemmatimonadaceae bacterium]